MGGFFLKAMHFFLLKLIIFYSISIKLIVWRETFIREYVVSDLIKTYAKINIGTSPIF